MECLFCQFVTREEPKEILFEDDDMIAFADIHPKAKIHLLFIPKKHLVSLADADPQDGALLGRMLLRIKEVAERQGIANSGYKIVINTREHGGQFIDHLHIHLLGGEPVKGLV